MKDYCSAVQNLLIVDGFTDPYDWAAQAGIVIKPSPGVIRLPSKANGHRTRQSIEEKVVGLNSEDENGARAIVIDSVNALIRTLGIQETYRFIRTILSHPQTSCVLGYMKLIEPETVATSIESLCSGVVELSPAKPLEREVVAASHRQHKAPQGRLRVRLKRRMGRWRADTKLYIVDRDGRVEFCDVPQGVPTPQVLVTQLSPATKPEEIAVALSGGMKLSLTPEEEEARRKVELPYEHKGQSSIYRTEDYRDYLPSVAGGRSGGGGLGHILYVRDSESDYDSDEDPDDDLDI